MAARSLISRLYPFVSLPHSSLIAASRSSSSLTRLRPLAAAAAAYAIVGRLISSPAISGGIRSLSTRPTVSSLNDPSPNFSNRPPKETILLEGCDFEHWLVVVDPPEPHLTRDEIIDSYIKTLAQVVGSEEEARMKIYSVSTKHYFAFGALVPEEVSYKIKELPKVRWVLPDSYLDVRNKDYGGEPFINGQAVPYDPKYHEEWVRNNARANERSRRNDRSRNSDRSRNFERRRENMQQNQNFPRDAPPPMPNDNFQRNPNMPPPQNAGPPNPNFNAPPMQNETYPRNPSPPPPQNARPPNPDYNAPPPIRNVPPPPPPPPSNQGYPGQMPSPSYPGGNQGHPGVPPQYQGPNQGYQGGNPRGSIPGSPNYHGGNPGYQGSSGSAYQGGYQGGNFGNTGYQGGYQGGNPSSYQPGGYQGGPTSAPAYEGRDVQGRDS